VALLERIAAATESNAAAILALAEQVASLRAELEERVVAAPSAVVQAPGFVGANCCDFQAESVVMTIDEEGQRAYKVRGYPFIKFGVRVWPEVLPQLGIDADTLKPGVNAFSATVRAVLNPEGRPKKVIGLAV
jgi:hypothetical protein